MESLSNQQANGNSNTVGSNVELTLLGIDKQWVRSNGLWVDKSTLPVQSMREEPIMSAEIEASSSHWWQFWKA